MASRTDQLQSHQFTLQRVVGALATRDPNPVSSPFRRIGGALFAGVLVAALALAAVGVYGALRPGRDSSWRTGNAVIIEQETGARFVFRDGVLYPVLNYSSALLILGSAQPTRASVSRESLVGVPRGTPLGIPGAPDLLPAPNDLITQPWTLCSRAAGATSPAPLPGTSVAAESLLAVGAGAGAAVDDLGDRGLLASDPGGGLHLLWHNRRYPITAPNLVLSAFAWSRQAVIPVAPALLNVIPTGADLGGLKVDRSTKLSGVAGLRVGEVFVVANQSGGRQFGVATPAGLADITPMQADLLIADGANGLGGKPKDLGQAEYAAAARAGSLVPTGDTAPPPAPPALADLVTGGGGICATFTSGGGWPTLGRTTAPPRAAGELRTARTGAEIVSLVDWVAVPPGRAALVEALAGPGSPNGALAVVSDLGLRFPVPSRDVLGMLGYPTSPPQRLPAALVSLLPTGKALDPAQAVRPATAGV